MSESEVSVTIEADVSGFVKALHRVVIAAHRTALKFMDKRVRRRHARRCDLCSPMANPKPLGIDGAAYRRKTKGRRGKR